MAIGAISSTGSPMPRSSTSNLDTAQHALQQVFTAVLKQAGHEGYASAEPLADETTLPEQIGNTWHQWFNQVNTTRYTFQAGSGNPSVQAGKSADDVQQDYETILLDAYSKGGYAKPQEYLRSLNEDQLKTVQQVHHLAEPIDTSKLSTEASLNLLLPPPAIVDENHDGLMAVGAGMLIGFPNSNTPKEVRDAWKAATANMPEQDRITYELQMMMPLVTANLKIDSDGQFIRSVQPGDADWVNPMNSPDFSYKRAADEWLKYLDRFRYQMSAEQYAKDKSFWSSFRDQLNSSAS